MMLGVDHQAKDEQWCVRRRAVEALGLMGDALAKLEVGRVRRRCSSRQGKSSLVKCTSVPPNRRACR